MALRVRRALDAAATLLIEPREHRRSVDGTRRGQQVRFEIDGTGWTVCARIPRGPYIVDIVRRVDRLYQGDVDLIEDVTYDDEDFDPRYIVGGAPHAFLARLLTFAQRRAIVELEPPEVRACDGELRIRKHYSYYYAEPADIALAIDLAVSLAERVHALLRDTEREVLAHAVGAGAPFRGGHDVTVVRGALQRRAAQVHRYLALEQERKRRNRNRVIISVALGTGWLAFNLLMAFVGA